MDNETQMNLLQTLIQQNLAEKLGDKDAKSLTLLPNDVITDIKRNIRKGAEDLNQNWSNALELVHKAYEVEGVSRPDPSMKDAWEQYESMLQYAVQQLSTNRGMKGDWRMSSAMFREAWVPLKKFRVLLDQEEYITEGVDAIQVITTLTSGIKDHETQISQKDGTYHLTFSKFRMKKNTTVTVTPI